MEERQVTVDGATYELPRPFMVMATQNPIEMEGTYPLPEAQRDRFIARVSMGYPVGASAELAMLDDPRRRLPAGDASHPVTDAATVRDLVDAVRDAATSPAPSGSTSSTWRGHPPSSATCGWAPPPGPGCSCCAPRGRAPRSPAATTCCPTTSSSIAVPVLAHRLILTGETQLARRSAPTSLADLLQRVRVPAPTR